MIDLISGQCPAAVAHDRIKKIRKPSSETCSGEQIADSVHGAIPLSSEEIQLFPVKRLRSDALQACKSSAFYEGASCARRKPRPSGTVPNWSDNLASMHIIQAATAIPRLSQHWPGAYSLTVIAKHSIQSRGSAANRIP
jgi:hypothetical protein